jgi:tol-pal system protein YbgF
MHMPIQSPVIRASVLLLCITCSACANLQHQLDRHERELAQLRADMARIQASRHSDIEQLRSDMQALSGSVEENTVVLRREIKDIQERLGRMTSAAAQPAAQETGAPIDSVPPPEAAVDTEQSVYDRALQLYQARNYEQARSSLQAFAAQYPASQLTQNALFWAGMCLFQQKKYQASIAAFEDLIKKFPQGTKVPDSYYWQALAFIEIKETLTAQILLETLMQTYPTSESAQKAKAKYQEITAGQQ